jgi:bisphosphoglycerate-independent phosphoglycerate mutase (AlkP superfamily)
MSESVKQKNVLLLVDGFGLSNSWQNNAILSAKTNNFQKYWDSNERLTLLSPITDQDETWLNLEKGYSLLSTGFEQADSFKFVNSKIKSLDISTIKELLDNLSSVGNKHSNLHLVGNISKNDELGSLEHLLWLVRLAKREKIFNVKIHLIADRSYPNILELKAKIDTLNRNIAEFDNAEIVSLVGHDSLIGDKSSTESIKNILSGTGKLFINPDQAFASLKNSTPADLEPICFTRDARKFVFDFDTIIFFNHNLSPIKNLVEQILSISGAVNLPNRAKYLKIFSLVDCPLSYKESISFIFTRDRQTNFCEKFSKNIGKSYLISDTFRSAILSHYFTNNDSVKSIVDLNYEKDSYDNIIRKVFNSIIDTASKNLPSIIVADLNLLARACSTADFKKILQAVKSFDTFLPLLIKELLAKDYNLIIVSTYGMAEKVQLFGGGYGTQRGCIPSKNSLPFLVVSHDNFSSPGLIGDQMLEMLSNKKDLRNAYQKICELLSVNI